MYSGYTVELSLGDLTKLAAAAVLEPVLGSITVTSVASIDVICCVLEVISALGLLDDIPVNVVILDIISVLGLFDDIPASVIFGFNGCTDAVALIVGETVFVDGDAVVFGLGGSDGGAFVVLSIEAGRVVSVLSPTTR